MQDTSCKHLKLKKGQIVAYPQAIELESLFKVLASDTRLRLLHALLIFEEMTVSEIAEAVDMKPQAISNQLQKLAAAKIVDSRRNGKNIYYKILDPCVHDLLERGICLIESTR